MRRKRFHVRHTAPQATRVRIEIVKSKMENEELTRVTLTVTSQTQDFSTFKTQEARAPAAARVAGRG